MENNLVLRVNTVVNSRGWVSTWWTFHFLSTLRFALNPQFVGFSCLCFHTMLCIVSRSICAKNRFDVWIWCHLTFCAGCTILCVLQDPIQLWQFFVVSDFSGGSWLRLWKLSAIAIPAVLVVVIVCYFRSHTLKVSLLECVCTFVIFYRIT